MMMTGAPELIGCMVAYKDRRQALLNPYAHLHQHELTFEQVVDSPMLWTRSATPRRARPPTAPAPWSSSTRPPATLTTARWPGSTHGHAQREQQLRGPQHGVAGRVGAVRHDVFAQAGIVDRRAEIDAVEMYVPFSWYEPMWLESLGFASVGEGWRMVESGATALDGGDLPVNCSGGCCPATRSARRG